MRTKLLEIPSLELLKIATRIDSLQGELASVLLKYTKKAIDIITIDDVLSNKEQNKLSRIIVCEAIFAALEGNNGYLKHDVLTKLIRSRINQIPHGISYLVTFLDKNIKLTQLISLLNEYTGDRLTGT
ncbi:hypothetical protein Psfp_02628 [Pelotomaculum sp. FP]|nr:hypothetical protein Psfp_02628 [Pelotomaculum sp. FP]